MHWPIERDLTQGFEMQTALICNCSPVLTNGMARCEGQALFKREEGGANDILLLRKPLAIVVANGRSP